MRLCLLLRVDLGELRVMRYTFPHDDPTLFVLDVRLHKNVAENIRSDGTAFGANNVFEDRTRLVADPNAEHFHSPSRCAVFLR